MQTLKNSVRLAIEKTALKLFAARGYDNTSMAEIAAAAGISTGNIYRYHANKEELLYAVIPESFAEICLQTIRSKISLVEGMSSQQAAGSKELKLGNERLLKFLFTHRRKILVLMRGCAGTRLAGFRNTVRQTIVDGVLAHFASLATSPLKRKRMPDKLLLITVYNNLITAATSILAADTIDKCRKETFTKLLAYHLHGMAALC